MSNSGIYYIVSNELALKVEVLDARKMGDLDKSQLVFARQMVQSIWKNTEALRSSK